MAAFGHFTMDNNHVWNAFESCPAENVQYCSVSDKVGNMRDRIVASLTLSAA
jgi:hypothetical protein